MNVLVLGGAGIVGSYLVETAPEGSQVYLGYRRRIPMLRDKKHSMLMDCSDEESLQQALQHVRPDIVVNAAGMNSVDECQLDPGLACESNVGSTLTLLRSLRNYSAKLVHLSTNAVYGGLEPPYHEHSPRLPVNVYGKTKRASEDLVRNCASNRWYIARLSPIFGWSRAWSRVNPLLWIVSSLRRGEKIKLCDDILDTPLSAAYAGQVLWQTMACDFEGELNIAGADVVSRFQFGMAVAEVFNLDADLIQGVPSTFFQDMAPRPPNSSFCTNRLLDTCSVSRPTLREGLEAMRECQSASDDYLVPGRLLAPAAAL